MKGGTFDKYCRKICGLYCLLTFSGVRSVAKVQTVPLRYLPTYPPTHHRSILPYSCAFVANSSLCLWDGSVMRSSLLSHILKGHLHDLGWWPPPLLLLLSVPGVAGSLNKHAPNGVGVESSLFIFFKDTDYECNNVVRFTWLRQYKVCPCGIVLPAQIGNRSPGSQGKVFPSFFIRQALKQNKTKQNRQMPRNETDDNGVQNIYCIS